MPAPPRVWPVFVAFVAALGAVGILSVILLVILAVAGGGIEALTSDDAINNVVFSAWGLVGSLAISAGVFAGVALTGASLSPTPWRARLRVARGSFGVLDVVLATVASLAFGTVANSVSTLLGVRDGSSLELMQKAVSEMTALTFAPAFVLGSLGAGIAEELLFRGYAQTRLVERWGRGVGIGVAAFFFGWFHFDLVHTPFAMILGVFLGWMTERHGTILLAIFVHVLNNAVSFLAMWLLPVESETGGDLWIAGLVAAVACAACVVLLVKRAPRPSVVSTPTQPPGSDYAASDYGKQ